MLVKFLRMRGWKRFFSALIIGLAGGLPAAAPDHAAESGMLHLRCTNPSNGANWPILVDLQNRLVDSLPARISDTWISWHNSKGGIFTFDRTTGKLQLSAPSSTGGYFLYYTCKPE